MNTQTGPPSPPPGFEDLAMLSELVVAINSAQHLEGINKFILSKCIRHFRVEQGVVHLLEPLGYAPFAWLMQRSSLILTDSGGIQEEAPSLSKPVLVMRNTTERPEGVEVGCVTLVGNETGGIVAAARVCLDDPNLEERAAPQNPYGDGQAARRIAEGLLARA